MDSPMKVRHCRHSTNSYSFAVELDGFPVQTSSWPRSQQPSPHSEFTIFEMSPTQLIQLGILIIQEAHVMLHREATPAAKVEA